MLLSKSVGLRAHEIIGVTAIWNRIKIWRNLRNGFARMSSKAKIIVAMANSEKGRSRNRMFHGIQPTVIHIKPREARPAIAKGPDRDFIGATNGMTKEQVNATQPNIP
jgi:hypothetical protein